MDGPLLRIKMDQMIEGNPHPSIHGSDPVGSSQRSQDVKSGDIGVIPQDVEERIVTGHSNTGRVTLKPAKGSSPPPLSVQDRLETSKMRSLKNSKKQMLE